MKLPAAVERSLARAGGLQGVISRLPEEGVLKRKSEVFRALSDPVRLKALHLLEASPLCVCLIKEALGDIADSKLSYHLSVLKNAGLIEGKRSGNWVIYRITKEGRRLLKRI